jgi:hypothetical protein
MAEGHGTAPGVDPGEDRFAEETGVRVGQPGPDASPEALEILERDGVDAWLDWLER